MPNKLDLLLANPTRFLSWWEAAPKEFHDFLEEWRNQLIGKLRKEQEIVPMYREQGEINAVEFLIQLDYLVREYVKGVPSGKFKDIGAKNVQK